LPQEIKPKTIYKSPDGKLYYVLNVNGSSAQVVECTIRGGKVKRVFQPKSSSSRASKAVRRTIFLQLPPGANSRIFKAERRFTAFS